MTTARRSRRVAALLPPDLYDRLEMLADQEGRGLDWQASEMLRQLLRESMLATEESAAIPA